MATTRLAVFWAIFTWAQLGLHAKPCARLNVRGYWDPLLALLDRAVEEGLRRAAWRGLVLHGAEVDRLRARLTTTPAMAR
jgi:predicted Rossmann-fold nucleotide-binding protein